ncbi:Rnase Y domain-containing protein, partial [bacterium]|nr:Rnase Y domain-containing protein [bacterium]
MELIWLIAALIVGAIFGFIIKKVMTSKAIDSAERKAEILLSDAKQKAKDTLLEAKGKSLQVIEEVKVEEKERRQRLQEQENRLTSRESMFDKKILEIEESKQKIANAKKQLEHNKLEIKKIKDEQFAKLEKIAALTQEEAKDVLIKNTEMRMKDELLHRIRKMEEQGSEEMEAKAKEMLSSVIERCAAPHTVETTTTSVTLPNEEMKGRIIGR